jgi:uncharacterized Zn finger protein (UPF0148 family)
MLHGTERQMTKINCKECGVAFHRTRDWQTFCCTKCRKDFNNRQDREEMRASAAQMNGHSQPKITIDDLSYARTPRDTVEVHRRKVASVG